MTQRRDSYSPQEPPQERPPRPDKVPMPDREGWELLDVRSSAGSHQMDGVEVAMRGLAPLVMRHASPRSPSIDDLGDAQTSRSELIDEIQRLKSLLDQTSTRAQTAETQAQQLTERLDQLSKIQESQSTDIKILEADKQKSDKQLQRLASELEDARSHIFSLQPYRKDLTPDEASSHYDGLVHAVSEWVLKFMEPILDNSDACKVVLKRSQKNSMLRSLLQDHPDNLLTSEYADTDPDVAASFVMKFLYYLIFQEQLCGIMTPQVKLLNGLEHNMAEKLEPKRDLFTHRSWKAEAFSALIATEGFAQAKHQRALDVTHRIMHMFEIFASDKRQLNEMTTSLFRQCVIPAIELHEKFITSTDIFYLDNTEYMQVIERRPMTSSEFYLDLDKLKCQNVLDNMKTFDIGKLRPPPGQAELRDNLLSLCIMAPALHMRKVGRSQSINEAVIVRKQNMLVAWGDVAKHERAKDKSDPRLMYKIAGGKR